MQQLCVSEIEEYIQCRLHAAGWQQGPEFKKDIYPLIHKITDGIPRIINQDCSRLLLHGFVENKHVLGIEGIENVNLELGEEQISTSHSVLKSENMNDKEYISLSPTNSNQELH